MKSYLKVKIKSLASEAAIIRLEERRAKARRREFIGRQGLEKRVQALGDEFNGLRCHRVLEVRTEARAANLAYAFIRNKPYAVTEPPGSKPFSLRRVATLATKYGAEFAHEDQIKAWASAA